MQKTAIKIQIKKHIASINSNIKNTTSFAKHCCQNYTFAEIRTT